MGAGAGHPVDERNAPNLDGVARDESPLEVARKHFDFHLPDVLVESSEGDHREEFEWTTSVEVAFVQALSERLQASAAPECQPIRRPRPAGDSVSLDDPRARASARPGAAATSSDG